MDETQNRAGRRTAQRSRKTAETRVEVDLDLDGGRVDINTRVPFLDHMLDQLARHGCLGLVLDAEGDLEIDAHHTVEDVGITLGGAFREAVGDRAGLRRFGWATAVLDEARVEVALDLSGRPFLVWEMEAGEGRIGDFDTQLLEEFTRAFVVDAGLTLHVVCVAGRNVHHVTEAAFKGMGRALSDALTRDPRRGGDVPSTKGMLA
ncbi:MAG: imidazoleglycerol-phosphate dehydratase HisB [Acidimicrobiia bacterium]|nr:imidazoleglycerol-phosphate dehydratase HisB [Acidimicrobiia bacterium]